MPCSGYWTTVIYLFNINVVICRKNVPYQSLDMMVRYNTYILWWWKLIPEMRELWYVPFAPFIACSVVRMAGFPDRETGHGLIRLGQTEMNDIFPA